jgi:hypothetical protein
MNGDDANVIMPFITAHVAPRAVQHSSMLTSERYGPLPLSASDKRAIRKVLLAFEAMR